MFCEIKYLRNIVNVCHRSMSRAMPEIPEPAGVASSGFQKAEFSPLCIILSTFRTLYIVFLITNGFYRSRIPCTSVNFRCTRCGKVKSSMPRLLFPNFYTKWLLKKQKKLYLWFLTSLLVTYLFLFFWYLVNC